MTALPPPSTSLLGASSQRRAILPGTSTTLPPDAPHRSSPLRAGLDVAPASGRHAEVESGGVDRASREACTRHRLMAAGPQGKEPASAHCPPLTRRIGAR